MTDITNVFLAGRNYDNQFTRLKTDLSRIQRQMVSGKKNDILGGFNRVEVNRVISLRTQFARGEQYIKNIDSTLSNIESMEYAANKINDTVDEIISARNFLGSNSFTTTDLTTFKTQADGALRFVRDLLNTNVNDKYLFGGALSTTQPVPNLSTLNTNVQSQIADYMGDNIASGALGNVDITGSVDLETDVAGIADGDSFIVQAGDGDPVEITVNSPYTTAQLLLDLNAVTNVSAVLDGSGFLQITPTSGDLSIAEVNGTPLQDLGINVPSTGDEVLTAVNNFSLTQLGYASGIETAGYIDVQVDDSQRVDYTTNASAQHYQDILRGLSMMANIEFEEVTDDQIADFNTILDGATSLLKSSKPNLRNDITNLGLDIKSLGNAKERHQETFTFLTKSIQEIENVNVEEKILEFQDTELKFQAALQVTSQLRELSLANFLF